MNQIADKHTRSAQLYATDFVPEYLLSKVDVTEPRKLLARQMQRAFWEIYSEHRGYIGMDEFKSVLSLARVKLNDDEVHKIFKYMDLNKNGSIEWEELENCLLKNHFHPREKIRCDMSLNLVNPKRFLKYHMWKVESRPFYFVLVSEVKGTEKLAAYFESSTDPQMSSRIEPGFRLTYINESRVDKESFIDIQGILDKIPCPFTLVFQSMDTIAQEQRRDSFEKVNSVQFSDPEDIQRQSSIFLRPEKMMFNPAKSMQVSQQQIYQYYTHCAHCPSEKAWYLNIHRFMEDEEYSAGSALLTYLVMLLIMVSTVTYIVETLPRWEDWYGWKTIEGVVSVTFTVEFLIRVASCREVKTYMKDPMNLIDFCAVIPYWIEIFTAGHLQPQILRVVRVVRLMRLIRLAKKGNLQDILTIYTRSINSSIHWLFMFVLIGMIVVIVFASLIYVCEVGTPTVVSDCDDLVLGTSCSTGWQYYYFTTNTTSPAVCQSLCEESALGGCCQFELMWGTCTMYTSSNVSNSSDLSFSGLCQQDELWLRNDGNPSPFRGIPNGIYFGCVTLMLIGYGEITPISDYGRLSATLGSAVGLLFISFPVITVGIHFTIARMRLEYDKLPGKVNSTLDASQKGTISLVLDRINKEVGLKLFGPTEELVFLSHENQYTTARKLLQVLQFDNGWAYLPFAYDDEPGLPRITQFKLFVLFDIFGEGYQAALSERKREKRKFVSEFERHVQNHKQSKKKRIQSVESESKWVDDQKYHNTITKSLKLGGKRKKEKKPQMLDQLAKQRSIIELQLIANSGKKGSQIIF